MTTITLGRSLLSLVAIVTVVGPYLADWSKSHVFNPNWPPHARFHNGQTMTTGLFLGLLTLYYLHFKPSTPQSSSNINHALLFIHLYYLPALSGILYPGALWTDPEFGEGRLQGYAFSVLVGVSWVGWWVERSRMDGSGKGKRV